MDLHDLAGVLRNGLEADFFVTISTCHVSLESMEKLSEVNNSEMPATLVYEYGVMMYTDDTSLSEEYEDINRIIRWATSRGINWVKLDADGPMVPELDIYYWG